MIQSPLTVCTRLTSPVNACVLGAFDDEDIIHVEGNVDPVRDIEIIHEELRLKDEEMIPSILDKLEKTAIRGGDKKLKPEYVSMYICYLFHISHKRAVKLQSICSPYLICCLLLQDIMLKVKNWIVEEKKHVRFYPDWNDKEVTM